MAANNTTIMKNGFDNIRIFSPIRGGYLVIFQKMIEEMKDGTCENPKIQSYFFTVSSHVGNGISMDIESTRPLFMTILMEFRNISAFNNAI